MAVMENAQGEEHTHRRKSREKVMPKVLPDFSLPTYKSRAFGTLTPLVLTNVVIANCLSGDLHSLTCLLEIGAYSYEGGTVPPNFCENSLEE